MDGFSQENKEINAPVNQLRKEYALYNAQFDAQPPIVQRFLETQAHNLAKAYYERAMHVHFTLPDRVIPHKGADPIFLDQSIREQRVGGFFDRLAQKDVHDTLRQRLVELEQSTNQATAIAASLVRFSTATNLVSEMLPSGRNVKYVPVEPDDIPSIPVSDENGKDSAISASTDAIVEEIEVEEERGSLQVPYVPAARRFFLPQWVAFDNHGKLLVNSIKEAEAHIASMQRFLNILFAARSLAPYMVAQEEFEKKRYGMLGQLVNQGRALAIYQNYEMIKYIKKRVEAQSLNRGLSISMPYFDDQVLRIETHDFVVIPAGRIMFVPAFVVRAVLEEQAKVAQDTRFNVSSRRHLMEQLKILSDAFLTSP